MHICFQARSNFITIVSDFPIESPEALDQSNELTRTLLLVADELLLDAVVCIIFKIWYYFYCLACCHIIMLIVNYPLVIFTSLSSLTVHAPPKYIYSCLSVVFASIYADLYMKYIDSVHLLL